MRCFINTNVLFSLFLVFILIACVPVSQFPPSAPPTTPTNPSLAHTVASPTSIPESVKLTPEPDELTVWGWKLLLLGEENVVETDLSLRLHEDGSLSGYTGCRAFRGVYQVSGERFLVSELETDGSVCSDASQGDLERRYLETLAQVETYWLGEDLVLTTDQGNQLDFMWETVTAEPPPGWQSFAQQEYGFQFHYPAGWRIEQPPDDPHHLCLVNGSMALTVGFRRLEEDVQITRTSMPAGDLQEQGWIEFIGGGISRDLLLDQGKTKAVLYNEGREMELSNGMIFTLSLDDLAQDPYKEVDIPPAAQLQIDWVARSFQLLPQVAPTPAYPTPTPWPVAKPLQVNLSTFAQIGQGTVQAIQWLADGRTLAVGTSLGVRLIDVESGQEKAFIATDKAVWRIKISPDGNTLAASQIGGGDYITPPSLWDLQSGDLLAELPDETGWDNVAMGGMAFSSDGKLLGTLDMEVMRVWDVRTGQLLHSLPRTGGVLTFSVDGTRLLTNEGDSLVVWDLAGESEQGRFATSIGDISFMALSPDGSTAAVLGQDVRLIAVQDRRELAVLDESQGVWGEILFSADGRYVSVGGSVWEVASGRLVRSFVTGDEFNTPILSPDLRFAAALPLLRDPDAVYLWDVASGDSLGPIFESKMITSFAFSSDGELLALVNLSQRIELWDVRAQRMLDRAFAPASIEMSRPAFSQDGSLLAAADGSDILLWETALGGEPRRLQSHSEPVCCLAFAGDGLTLFSGGRDNQLLQWDLQTGMLLRTFEGLKTDVVALAVSPGGNFLASGSSSVEYDLKGENPTYEHQPIRIWDAHTGELLRGFNYTDVLSLAISPDASWLAARLTIEPGLIDVKTGHHIQSLPNQESPNYAVHPEGRLLAMGFGRDIQLWDVAARQTVLSLKGDQNYLYWLAFSPDGHLLASIGMDGVLRLWRVEIS